MSEYHQPVMFRECLEGLEIKPDGVYVDVTFGGGGHSKGIFDQLTTGHLIAFDQDKDAEKNATYFTQIEGEDKAKSGDEANEFAEASAKAKRSFTFIGSNFRYLKKFLKVNGVTEVDGILATKNLLLEKAKLIV